ncbi:MAG: gluconate 2-dehydrogenase subunit 3 family protein [Verrucomicrobiota bacterium]
MDNSTNPDRLPRRQVLQWFASAAAGATIAPALPLQAQDPAAATGYGTDPNLVKFYEPGDFWALTLTDDQRKLVTALVDVVIPADDLGPAASEVRVPDFVDEWISAPYPKQKSDRDVILPGLKKFEEATQAKHGKPFADLGASEQSAFCETVAAEGHPLAGFFHRFTMVAIGAYYSTPQGWQAIGYVGNMPSGIFAGPPPEVLEQVGVEQTVA